MSKSYQDGTIDGLEAAAIHVRVCIRESQSLVKALEEIETTLRMARGLDTLTTKERFDG